MHILLLLAFGVLQAGSRDVFAVQAELQARYDEISQATQQFATASDVDQFHDVFYAPDWVFIDATGQRRTWPQLREQAIQAINTLRFDLMIQPIQKLSLAPEGATVVITETTERTIVDREGRYGSVGASHTLTESTTFRDVWALATDDWKLKLREQIGPTKTMVDKPAHDR